MTHPSSIVAGKIGKIVKGTGIAAKAGGKQIKNAATKVKNSVATRISGPDRSDRKAPHYPIGNLNTKEDYVHLKSDVDFVEHLSKRLERNLRYILECDDKGVRLDGLIEKARKHKVFGDDGDLYLSILNFSIVRNKMILGEEAPISLKNRLIWTRDVFELEDGVEETGDSENTDADI